MTLQKLQRAETRYRERPIHEIQVNGARAAPWRLKQRTSLGASASEALAAEAADQLEVTRHGGDATRMKGDDVAVGEQRDDERL
eukprot:CAMPEP_0174827742 /NCGR_PEP_ID=MMETSP1114-20130205/907_1 /TAXON_ID=312471 /ORGANISM="Neobodo designis, Strain CCAP 1951/1" /LENGTH=83 /DNA_ID=CAMNT_0016061419 /DNA_START=322 /DNA_END=568 /DNA_ORIENTATION=+